MLESKIEKSVCDYAKKQGFYVRKFKAPGQRGVPDRIFLSPIGQVFFIEFKAEGKRPSDLQKREIRLIENCKGSVYVIDNVPDGKLLVDVFFNIEGYAGQLPNPKDYV